MISYLFLATAPETIQTISNLIIEEFRKNNLIDNSPQFHNLVQQIVSHYAILLQNESEKKGAKAKLPKSFAKRKST